MSITVITSCLNLSYYLYTCMYDVTHGCYYMLHTTDAIYSHVEVIVPQFLLGIYHEECVHCILVQNKRSFKYHTVHMVLLVEIEDIDAGGIEVLLFCLE